MLQACRKAEASHSYAGGGFVGLVCSKQKGRTRANGMRRPMSGRRFERTSVRIVVGGLVGEAQNDELRGLYRCHADLGNQASIVDVVLRHGRSVTAHEKGM